MRLLNLILIMLLWCVQSFGQDTLSSVFHFDPDTLDKHYNGLVDYAYMYVDSTKSLEIDGIIKTNFEQKADFSTFKKIGGLFKYPIWVKVTLKPEQKIKKDSVILNVPFGFNYQVYETAEDTIFRSIGGIDSWKHPSQMNICKFSFPLRIVDTVPRDIFVKYSGYNSRNLSLHLANIEERIAFHESLFFRKRGLLLYLTCLVSAITFLGLFFLVRYVMHSENYLLYYSLYLIGVGMMLLRALESNGELHLFWRRIALSDHLWMIFIPVVFIFFGFYVKHILNLKKGHILYLHYKTFMISLIAALSINTILFLLFLLFDFRHNFRIVGGITLIPPSLIGLVFTIKLIISKNMLHRLIGTGLSSVTLACLLISILYATRLNCRYNLFLEIAYIIEIFFLTLAIGFKTKSTNKVLIATQNELLAQEKLNLINQQKLNFELSRLVEEKTKDIITTNKALADQEKLKLEAEFNEKIANAELKALKAQMNPHFIFNCLNAIRNLVQKGKDDQATEYLADFASFIRKVLSYSEVRQITLEEELEICELYIKMEQLRFEDGFDYKIIVDPGTATDFIMLPPMLLQPLLENAIWHGLLHKQKDRCLTIHINQDDQRIICVIEDNGVGRTYSTQLNGSKNRDSIGLKLFIDRLDINNQLLNNNYNYEIIDKYHNNKSTGTKVNLFFEI